MTHTPHELHEEFPDDAGKIHTLKATDRHFLEIADHYHRLNRMIHRMDAGIETVADNVLEDVKKARLALKDQIAAALAKAS